MPKLINIAELLEKNDVGKFLSATDLIRGERLTNNVYFAEDGVFRTNGITRYYFSVESEFYYDKYYEVFIDIKNNKVVDVNCECEAFKKSNRCKHIGACIMDNIEMLFKKNIDTEEISNIILDKFVSDSKSTIKKEVDLELKIELNDSYYWNSFLEPKVSIGENRLYSLNNKISSFSATYLSGDGEVKFGKNFTYNPRVNYFNEENTKIIEAFIELCNGNSNRYFAPRVLKKFLNAIKDCHFIYKNYKIDGIKEKFPLKSNLSKKDNNYTLNFDVNELEVLFDDDYEFVFYQGNLYKLNKKEQELLETIIYNDVTSINIKKDKIEAFTNGLMNLVKKNMDVDASVDDLVVTKDIKAETYFDLRRDYIICDVKFIYDDKVVGYFDSNSSVLRDMEFESNVINDLLKYSFEIKDNKLILVDLEKQVSFIENGLEELSSKYVVYTTEKFKKLSVRKKTNVTSMFGIGSDNILSFNFSLGDIPSEELVNVFKSIKNKKKYYKLKNGDILNLEDESLQELEDLSQELELTDEDIINGHGSILKYRAIYLDSLKNTKYNIIKTDNLFDNLIKKFYAFKDSDLSLKDLRQLRDYQITGVKWLYNLDKTGFGGILADEMGLGKTIQIIYYIKQMLEENSSFKFLIVVPTSLAYNWEHEFDEFAPEIKKVICVGNKDKRIKILNNLDNINVLITTYGILREDEDLYHNITFHGIIIDEAQNIKNNMAGITKVVKSMQGDVKFALTGTPLENSILELWSIFDFVMPGYLTSLTKFQSKYRIKDFDEDSELLLKGLSHQINPFILRRKKKDVIKELPDKLINDIYIDLSDEQKKLYAAELERVKEEMAKIIASEGISKARFLILQVLMKLRQICIDPNIIYENYDGGSNKIDTLINIVGEYIANGHKILIFSSFKKALDEVSVRLKKEKIKYHMIDGSVSSKNRINMVDDFNSNEDVKVFLITLKAGGTGLNLASADVVIHLDLWWNPQAENQATDRAHRIGQKNTVEVIHLISKGTIEEKILELQNKKRMLSDKLIDGEIRDKNILSELTEEDIKNLLAYENKE